MVGGEFDAVVVAVPVDSASALSSVMVKKRSGLLGSRLIIGLKMINLTNMKIS
jgi:hypothetical protein